jgi:cobalamin synthase
LGVKCWDCADSMGLCRQYGIFCLFFLLFNSYIVATVWEMVWRILHCLQAKDNLQQLLTSNSMNNDRYNYHLCYMVVFLLYIFHFQLLCICFSSLFYLLITIRYFRKYASVTRPLQTGDCIGLMNYLKMGYQFKSSPKRSNWKWKMYNRKTTI